MDNKMKSVLSMIPYVGWIPSLFFLFIEKNHTVRWYSLQSLYLHLTLVLLNFVAFPLMRLSIFLLPVVVILSGVVGVGFLILCLYACLQLYNGHDYKIGLISYFVDATLREKHANK